jgi:hypothetical protein
MYPNRWPAVACISALRTVLLNVKTPDFGSGVLTCKVVFALD